MDRKSWKRKRRKPRGCSHCSKKTHGRPKYGRGLCGGYDLRETVKERRRWRHQLQVLGEF